MQKQVQILDSEQMQRMLERLAFQILEFKSAEDKLALMGIQRRGVQIAERLKFILDEKLKEDLPFGKLDINFYRDDWTTLDNQPCLNSTDIPFSLDNKEILLVDDVLFTGRTIRAALEAILDFGRPYKVKLLVLVDRGHRELPIRADFVGKSLNTSREEQVDVLVKEIDGRDEVLLLPDF